MVGGIRLKIEKIEIEFNETLKNLPRDKRDKIIFLNQDEYECYEDLMHKEYGICYYSRDKAYSQLMHLIYKGYVVMFVKTEEEALELNKDVKVKYLHERLKKLLKERGMVN